MNRGYLNIGLGCMTTFLTTRQYYISDTNKKFDRLLAQLDKYRDESKTDMIRMEQSLKSDTNRQIDILRNDSFARFDRLEALIGK